MKRQKESWPLSPHSDEIDNIAVSEFDHRCSPRWVRTEPRKDVGWDRIITIKENAQIKGKSFLVQIKGSDSPNYIKHKICISHPIKVSTIDFLLGQNMPAMLCICDTKEHGKPIYWIWLNEFIKKVEDKNPQWIRQKTINVHIPKSGVLNKASHKEIENYVIKHFNSIYIQREIGSRIAHPFGLSDEIYQPKISEIQSVLSEQVFPHLQDLGLIDTVKKGERIKIRALSRKDQELHKKIKEVSFLLESFHDLEAENKLDSLSKEIESGSTTIIVKYYNNLGVLALHNNEFMKARKYFRIAHKLDLNEIKYALNLLYAEYLNALGLGNLIKYLPRDWEKRLNIILTKDENYSAAIFLRSHWIANVKSAGEAIKLIKKSKAWQDGKLDARIVLANIYLGNANIEKAIRLFEEMETIGIFNDEISWSIYGDALFLKAVGMRKPKTSFSLIGPGPSSVDEQYLRKAQECYAKAIDLFKTKGLPRISEHTVVNYAASLSLSGEYDVCEAICEFFLSRYPDCIPVIENLVAALNFKKNPEDLDRALQYARHAFKIDPDSTRVYCNLILSLFCAEDFEDIIEIASDREKQGFKDKTEEGLSRGLIAVSYYEIGLDKESNSQIQIMKKDPFLVADAALAEAEIGKRELDSKEKIIGILKSALKKKKDERLLTKMVHTLQPVDKDNAEEVIKTINQISSLRQLTPTEFSFWGKAYLVLNSPDKAQIIFYRAMKRYPKELEFVYLSAISFYETGNEQDAYNCLIIYLNKSEKSYILLRNIALLARDIGKLRESASLFEMALHKAAKSDQRAEIHCLLYEIKIRLNKSAKEILKHVYEYGKLIKGDKAEEARYLMMFLLAPRIKEEDIDAEVKVWIKEFQERLKLFSEENPNYRGLFSLKVPDKLSDEEKGQYILAQLAYLTLPARLRIAPFLLAIESQPWPLALRSQILPEARSIFDYWSICVRSSNYSNAIHIWRETNSLEIEGQNSKTREICIDLSALLTLAELNLLNCLSICFDRIVIARETKISIDIELASPFNPHPIAESIERWRIKNLNKIRVYRLRLDNSSYNQINSDGRILIPRNKDLNEIIGDGIGESVLLSRERGLFLYSDDSLIREWATNNYGIKTFSTLSLISRLREERKIDICTETTLYSEMIRKNFRIIPFQPMHLTSRLESMVEERNKQSLPSPKCQDFLKDEILGAFLRQFGEPSLNPLVLANIAINWWISVLQNKQSICELIDECMEYISFSLAQRTTSRIITGIKKDENERNAAVLWGTFWWRCNLEDTKLNNPAWCAIKESCRRLFPNSIEKQEKVLFRFIPGSVIVILHKQKNMPKDQKYAKLVELTEKCFIYKEPDKAKLEEYFARMALKGI